MENRVIDASLSTQSLTFRPGGPPVSFEVIVVNGSDQFAAFQLEVLAPGVSRSSGNFWYRLSPEVAAAKPTGGITPFQIVIVDNPLPAFVGTINLTVRVFSPQLREERKLLVRLTIEQGTRPTLLSLDLPVQRLQVYPRNAIDIPVRVRNLSQQSVDVVLRCVGFERSWLVGSVERRLLIDPGTQVETSFQCQPPSAIQAPSQDYFFTIEASSRDGTQCRTEGILEVLPVGFTEFTATPQQQTIPNQGRWLADWKSDSTSFQLLFKNTSNLRQQVNVQLQGKDYKKCTCTVVPEDAELDLGEITKVHLKVSIKRLWLGLAKTLRFEVKALLSDQRLGSTDPATQTLELKVLPIVPLWLLLALSALLAALLALLLRSAPIAHTDLVNSVRFSGNAFSVVSGSDDCTIRVWRINAKRLELEPEGRLNKYESFECGKGNDTPPEPKGLLGVANQLVWALRFDPVENDRVAAGLNNSVIQLWNVPNRIKEYELKVQELFDKGDKVFDLIFTKNFRYLISGHGSGRVLMWKRPIATERFEPNPERDIALDYQARALALSQDERFLAIAGNKKYLTLLDLTKLNSLPRNNKDLTLSELIKLDIYPRQFSVIVPNLPYGDNDFIWSLAFAPKPSKLLATADSHGYITILDLEQCQINNIPRQLDEPINQECAVVRDRWQAAKTAVRSIAFNLDGSELVSAGDDGRVVTWPLTSDKLDRQKAVNGQPIYKSSKKINSIAMTKDNQGTMIVSGGDDFQVKLHRMR